MIELIMFTIVFGWAFTMTILLVTIYKQRNTLTTMYKTIADQEDDIIAIDKQKTKNYDNYLYNKETSQELRKEFKMAVAFVKDTTRELEETKILLLSIQTNIQTIDYKAKKKEIKEKLEVSVEKIDKYIFNK